MAQMAPVMETEKGRGDEAVGRNNKRTDDLDYCEAGVNKVCMIRVNGA